VVMLQISQVERFGEGEQQAHQVDRNIVFHIYL
jgi:hypothetical protein